ncbi:hypothetical protein SEPCBS57363_006795 [Sporothrix epigloea]|uniref:C2H2-type domain-containing protein n=1 Tax=Sporothrix epigloea TaxID=1892477 RepID=A0ABP0E6S9_9PEZI
MSFVTHESNKLYTEYTRLLDERESVVHGGLIKDDGVNRTAAINYLQTVDQLEKALVGGLYTACGQAPRAEELLSILFANSSSTARNVFIYNGHVVYITRYHKAQWATQREFYVARFLPERLGQVMASYMVFVRPFAAMLRENIFAEAEVSTTPGSERRFLFEQYRKGAAGTFVANILRYASKRVWRKEINIRQYRQLSIGIAEKHVQELSEPFNIYDDRSREADLNMATTWQSGHRPLRRGISYGLDAAFPTRLQPSLLRAYEWSSTSWHEFLGQASSAPKETGASRASRVGSLAGQKRRCEHGESEVERDHHRQRMATFPTASSTSSSAACAGNHTTNTFLSSPTAFSPGTAFSSPTNTLLPSLVAISPATSSGFPATQPHSPAAVTTPWTHTEAYAFEQPHQQLTGAGQMESGFHNWLEVVDPIISQTQVIQPPYQPRQPADLVSINAQHQMLICKICSGAVIPGRVEYHMRCHKLKGEELRQLLKFTAGYVFANPTTCPLPTDGSVALLDVPLHHGFRCSQCSYRVKIRDVMLRHLRQAPHEGAASYEAVKLQTWCNGGLARYWIVQSDY